jgi:hypothetical protein
MNLTTELTPIFTAEEDQNIAINFTNKDSCHLLVTVNDEPIDDCILADGDHPDKERTKHGNFHVLYLSLITGDVIKAKATGTVEYTIE